MATWWKWKVPTVTPYEFLWNEADMKISINSGDTKLVFRFPTGLVFNRLTAGIVCRKLKKEGFHLTRKQTVLFIKELKRYKKTHRDWNLVEVEGSDEDSVIVKI